MALQSWEENCREFFKNNDSSGIENISQAIKNKHATLLDVVESLGDRFSDPEKATRASAVKLLSLILHQLTFDHLSVQEVSVLLTFYCARIEDHYSIQPHVITGLLALSRQHQLPDDGVIQICRAIFTHIQTQTLLVSDRLCVYQIYAHFLHTRLQVLCSMGNEFVYGYIQVMDSEKDPRNLLLAFDAVQIIAKHFPIAKTAEELFEVVACYFPVDFTSPANDPYSIKKEELIVGLRSCLCASSQFAVYCWPLLLEKATSSLSSAKLDTFQTISACCSVYSPAQLAEYTSSFWSAFRKEVLYSNSETNSNAALQALTDVTKLLHRHNKKSEFTDFVEMILMDCDKSIVEPDIRLSRPAFDLLVSVTRESYATAVHVLSHVVGKAVHSYRTHMQVKARQTIIDGIRKLLEATAIHGANAEPALPPSLTGELCPLLLSVLIEEDTESHCTVLQCVRALYTLPTCLSIGERTRVVQHCVQRIHTVTRADVCDAYIDCLISISKLDPELLTHEVLPMLHTDLFLESPVQQSVLSSNQYAFTKTTILDLLSFVCTHIDLQRRCIEIIKQFIMKCYTEIDNSQNDLALHAIKRLRYVISHHTGKTATETQHMNEVVISVVVMAVTMIRHSYSHQAQCIAIVMSRVQEFAECIEEFMTVADYSHRQLVCSRLYDVCVRGDLTHMHQDDGATHWQPLQDKSATNISTSVVHLLAAGIAYCIPETPEVLDNVMQEMLDVILRCQIQACTDKATHLLANLLNKIPDEAKVDRYITSSILPPIASVLDVTHTTLPSTCIVNNKYIIELLVCVTKATVMRGLHTQSVCLQQLMSALSHKSLGSLAAEGFDRILNRTANDLLTSRYGCMIKLLYHQRFCMTTSNELIERFHLADNVMKANYLTALSNQQQYFPDIADVKPLLPLLIECLSYGDALLWRSVLHTLRGILQHDASLCVPYIDIIVEKCIVMMQCKRDMKVRMEALRCLGDLAKLESHHTSIHRQRILRELKLVRDDHKRLVRAECVNAITAWELYGF